VNKEVRHRKPGIALSQARLKRIVVSDDESEPEQPVLETGTKRARQETESWKGEITSITSELMSTVRSAKATQVSVPVSMDSVSCPMSFLTLLCEDFLTNVPS
jgi:hypothetical protein